MPDRGSELFISDLHLSAHTPETTARFLAFLDGPALNTVRLTILGDLFDAWAGDDDLADPFNAGVLKALRTLADRGVAVGFMAGNRDFLVGTNFARAAGLELLPDPCLREIHGIATLLTHGDTLCTDDTDYQHFRTQVRRPEWSATFLARPLAERKQEIEKLRTCSEAEKRSKPIALMDVNAAAVIALLQKHDAQAIIHGHTHRQAQHIHTVAGRDCRRWVLGDWHPGCGNALLCSATEWRWLQLTE